MSRTNVQKGIQVMVAFSMCLGFIGLLFLLLTAEPTPKTAQEIEQQKIEQEIENKRRMKIVDCDHAFENLGDWSGQKVMCPKCGVTERAWNNKKF